MADETTPVGTAPSESAPKELPGLARSDGERIEDIIRRHRDMVISGKGMFSAKDAAQAHANEVANQRIQRMQFVQSQTEGVVSLTKLSARAVEIRETTDKMLIASAELYGALMDLQRYSYILGQQVGHPIVQHLTPPDQASPDVLVDLRVMTRAARESRRLIETVIRVFQRTGATQKTATENIAILLDALNGSYVEHADLRSVAEGETGDAPRALAEEILKSV